MTDQSLGWRLSSTPALNPPPIKNLRRRSLPDEVSEPFEHRYTAVMLARVVTSLAMSLPVAAPIAGYFTWKLSSKVAASKRASLPSPGGKSLSSRKG